MLQFVSGILLFPQTELIVLWGAICTRCNYSRGAICLIAGWRIMMKIAAAALVCSNWFIQGELLLTKLHLSVERLDLVKLVLKAPLHMI